MNKETNDKILELLKEYLDKYPDQRFCQALMNCNILEQGISSNINDFIILDPFYKSNESVIENILQVLDKPKDITC